METGPRGNSSDFELSKLAVRGMLVSIAMEIEESLDPTSVDTLRILLNNRDRILRSWLLGLTDLD